MILFFSPHCLYIEKKVDLYFLSHQFLYYCIEFLSLFITVLNPLLLTLLPLYIYIYIYRLNFMFDGLKKIKAIVDGGQSVKSTIVQCFYNSGQKSDICV